MEFTQNQETPQHTFDDDDSLVFYPESQKDFDDILINLKNYEVPVLAHKNPYWKDHGICF